MRMKKYRKSECVGVVGLVVRISAFQADGPGSIPGRRITFSKYYGLHVGLTQFSCQKAPPAGLEPAIFGLEVRRVIHYATRAVLFIL